MTATLPVDFHKLQLSASKFMDTLNKILSAVVDRRGAECGHEFVIIRGCRAVHFQPGQLAQLKQGRPYASRCPMNEDTLPAGQMILAQNTPPIGKRRP